MERHYGEHIEIDFEFSIEIPIFGKLYLNCLQKTAQNCFLVGTDCPRVFVRFGIRISFQKFGLIYKTNFEAFLCKYLSS